MVATAAVAIENLADAEGVLFTAPSIANAPPELLVDPQVGTKWRDNSDLTFIVIDLLTPQLIDTIALMGVSGTTPIFRVRLSLIDSSAVAGEVYDSASFSGAPGFDPSYGMMVVLITAPVSARYIRIDIEDAGVDYIEAGRLYIGARSAFSIDYQLPWSRTAVRGSVNTFSIGGQTFVDLRTGSWKTNISFGFLSETDRATFLEEFSVAIVNTGHQDVLWIKQTDSTNRSRDCLWGYHDGDLVMTQNQYIVPAVYSVEFQVRQRL